MGLVKLVKNHATKSKTNKKSLQNRLYQNISTESSWRFLLKQKSNICLLDTFSCEVIDFVEKMNLPCQFFFVEGS